MDDATVRSWNELRSNGLLWLINATVFHPRGYALAFVLKDGQPVGWRMLGDGTEPWHFEPSTEVDESFQAVEAFFTYLRRCCR